MLDLSARGLTWLREENDFQEGPDTGRKEYVVLEGEPQDDTKQCSTLRGSKEKQTPFHFILTLPAGESHSKQCDLRWGTSYSQHRPLGTRSMIDDSSRRGRADRRQC